MAGLKQIAKGAVAVPTRLGLGFFGGLKYPFRGMRFVYGQHIDLVRFWLPPLLITILMVALVFGGILHYHDTITDWIWSAPTGDSFWASVGRFFHGVFDFILGLSLALGGLVLVMLSTSVLAAPFNDALSAEVERIVTGVEGPPFSVKVLLRDLLRTVGLESVKLFLYALVMAPLFALSLLLPVVGQIVYSVFGFVFTAMYFALDYIDWPATRAGRDVGGRLDLGRRNFSTMFGFGTGVWLFLFVPFLNLFFMPAAVAGGTLLYLDMTGPVPESLAPPSDGQGRADAGSSSDDAASAPAG